MTRCAKYCCGYPRLIFAFHHTLFTFHVYLIRCSFESYHKITLTVVWLVSTSSAIFLIDFEGFCSTVALTFSDLWGAFWSSSTFAALALVQNRHADCGLLLIVNTYIHTYIQKCVHLQKSATVSTNDLMCGRVSCLVDSTATLCLYYGLCNRSVEIYRLHLLIVTERSHHSLHSNVNPR